MKSKIARLPKSLRNELGRRIDDGCSGAAIVTWLNDLPEVRKIVAEQFKGRAISEQNLSDWKQSGHLEWLRRQDAAEAAISLLNAPEDLDLEDPNQPVKLMDN